MLPPPAPTEMTSSDGVVNGSPSMEDVEASAARPSSMSATSADVPPMSIATKTAIPATPRRRAEDAGSRPREQRVDGSVDRFLDPRTPPPDHITPTRASDAAMRRPARAVRTGGRRARPGSGFAPLVRLLRDQPPRLAAQRPRSTGARPVARASLPTTERVMSFEEGQLFGPEWLRSVGMIRTSTSTTTTSRPRP